MGRDRARPDHALPAGAHLGHHIPFAAVRLTASATCRWPIVSNPTTLTTGASITISRHTAIDSPAAASPTDATSTAPVAMTSSTWNASQPRISSIYSRYTAMMNDATGTATDSTVAAGPSFVWCSM